MIAHLSLILFFSFATAQETLVVGSKKFTESVILGEMIAQIAEQEGLPVRHRSELGGTRVLWNALVTGEIDVYPEYTGTLQNEILKNNRPIAPQLEAAGVAVSQPLGFHNSYGLGMKKSKAQALGIQNISDLISHPGLKMGFSHEFLQRSDGWSGLSNHYRLQPAHGLKGLDHAISYRALDAGEIDVIDIYTTDPEVLYYDLLILGDDLHFFQKYDAVIIYKKELKRRFPKALQIILNLEGQLPISKMQKLNADAKIKKIPEKEVSRLFLSQQFPLKNFIQSERSDVIRNIYDRFLEHFNLVLKSMLIALFFGLPLGIFAARNSWTAPLVLHIVGILQTIPALALLVLLIRPLKAVGLPAIGDAPAIIALSLYSLLPIIRNTAAGLQNISKSLIEAADSMGMSRWQRLKIIELPLATPVILAGIKTAIVMNIGFATLGALIGAGGFGQPILTGIRLDDHHLILQGAIPSALLAIAVQAFFGWMERKFFAHAYNSMEDP